MKQIRNIFVPKSVRLSREGPESLDYQFVAILRSTAFSFLTGFVNGLSCRRARPGRMEVRA